MSGSLNKFKNPLAITAILALVLLVCSALMWFIRLGEGSQFSIVLFNVVDYGICIAAAGLVVMCAVESYSSLGKKKTEVALLAALAISEAFSILWRPIYGFSLVGSIYDVVHLVFGSLFAAAIIEALMNRNRFAKIAIFSSALYSPWYTLSSFFYNFDYYANWASSADRISLFFRISAIITFNASLLLLMFGAKGSFLRMSLEEKLRLLNEKFELGIIAEAEYWAQREEIITKL